MNSGPNAEWWRVLLDGKPHDVKLGSTDHGTLALLRAAIYRTAEALGKVARTKRVLYMTLRVQAWPQHEWTTRGQVESEGIEPLPPYEKLSETRQRAKRELLRLAEQDATAAAIADMEARCNCSKPGGKHDHTCAVWG